MMQVIRSQMLTSRNNALSIATFAAAPKLFKFIDPKNRRACAMI